jgi:radical SAM superfamily enzyme YgiQ (UPF0313 family)
MEVNKNMLKAWWAKMEGYPNFGDLLTEYILNKRGVQVEYVPKPELADLIGCGSILDPVPDDFKGLAKVIQGPGEIGEIEDLTPSRHLLDSRKYGIMQEGLRTSTAITSRGCPNNCVFCGNLNRKVV